MTVPSVSDAILRGLIERQLSVSELVAEGMDKPTVERVARMVAAAEYKRRQSAPGVKITPMAFGRDRRWPITNSPASFRCPVNCARSAAHWPWPSRRMATSGLLFFRARRRRRPLW